MDITSITKEDFDTFVKVRDSGKTNMFDLEKVEMLSELPVWKIELIMIHFTQLSRKYGIN